MRDSQYCGVSYGNFDVDWLISCMTMHEDQICISVKGVRALEHYLMARRLMTHNVYYHKTSSAATYLLECFFKLLFTINEQNKSVAFLTEQPLIRYIRIVSEHIKSESYENNIIQDGFEYYSRLTEHDIWSLIYYYANNTNHHDDESKLLSTISNMFLERRLPLSIKINQHHLKNAEKIIKEFCSDKKINKIAIKLRDPSLSIYDTKENEIFVKENIKGKHVSISSVLKHSELINNYSNKKEIVIYLHIIESLVETKEINNLLKTLNNAHCIELNEKINKLISKKNEKPAN